MRLRRATVAGALVFGEAFDAVCVAERVERVLAGAGVGGDVGNHDGARIAHEAVAQDLRQLAACRRGGGRGDDVQDLAPQLCAWLSERACVGLARLQVVPLRGGIRYRQLSALAGKSEESPVRHLLALDCLSRCPNGLRPRAAVDNAPHPWLFHVLDRSELRTARWW